MLFSRRGKRILWVTVIDIGVELTGLPPRQRGDLMHLDNDQNRSGQDFAAVDD